MSDIRKERFIYTADDKLEVTRPKRSDYTKDKDERDKALDRFTQKYEETEITHKPNRRLSDDFK
ncbi:hypothetical protein LF817_13410 [Halobacillus sp. A1]|uniref:hypothetical protein n=1 Tax=Halobacillus sp. A1 TaxID=2880262 RepID=UPI0020A623A7|nr:hypothetical protein [Halobacillus sp. A1]MCP3032340.1 hypothetical protein [Halobacillus sp. A1]